MKCVTKIPLPGGSDRVPTGAMQFENDWPGLFIRGDNAVVVKTRIRWLEARIGDHDDPEVRSAIQCLAELADIIDRDVNNGTVSVAMHRGKRWKKHRKS